jgi:hypothetical protein
VLWVTEPWMPFWAAVILSLLKHRHFPFMFPAHCGMVHAQDVSPVSAHCAPSSNAVILLGENYQQAVVHSQAAAEQIAQAPNEPCANFAKTFADCMSDNNGDLEGCRYYFDKLQVSSLPSSLLDHGL